MTSDAFAGQPVIIGGGIAGLMTALHLAPEPCVILTKASLGGDSSSELAQGGIAAALGPDDSPARHMADTMKAGDGLCDADIVRTVTEAAPGAIAALERFGVRFDRADDGRLGLGLEAAHCRNRIVHASGDGTGRELMRALADAVRRTASITILEHVEARSILTRDGVVAGVIADGPDQSMILSTQRVVIATGGIGGLFEDTTNPTGCWGQGLTLAARAGAELADLEFIQFHPTALDGRTRPMRLVSEAVRGEGAVLIDETGERFLASVNGGELAPRDVVARAVAAHIKAGHNVFLDARQSLGPKFASRFPAIDEFCREAGVDPAHSPVPVRPAAHYHMGGIATDADGRSTVTGLWACGEAAATGLHGANRLASNSLLEAAVFARRVAESMAGAPTWTGRRAVAAEMPLAPDPDAVRPIASRALGVVRNRDGLQRATAELLPMAMAQDARTDPAALALMIAVSAYERGESRGAHYRTDCPSKAAARRSRITLREALAMAHAVTNETMPLARSA